MAKDVGLFVDGAARADVVHTVATAVAESWQSCHASLPGSDFTEIWRHVSAG
jgi:hypothetical protein